MNTEPGFERHLQAADFDGSAMLEPGCHGFETALEQAVEEKKTMKYPVKIILMAVLWLSTSTAFAAMVSTPHLIAESERAQLVRNMAERQQVEQQLIELGVDPVDARAPGRPRGAGLPGERRLLPRSAVHPG